MMGLTMLLKALGVEIDPEALAKWITDAQIAFPQFIQSVQNTLQTVDARLQSIQAEQAAIRAMLEGGSKSLAGVEANGRTNGNH